MHLRGVRLRYTHVILIEYTTITARAANKRQRNIVKTPFLQYDENERTEVMTQFLYFFKDSKPTKVRFQVAAKERTTQVFISLDVPF